MVDELDGAVGAWLGLDEVADVLGVAPGNVRRLLQDRHLLGLRRGERGSLRIPAELVRGGRLLDDLRGTLLVLADAGFSDEEALRWLFTVDASLPGTPVEALRAGRKTEVRRRAQALAF